MAEIDLEQIAEHYAKMPDEQLRRIVTRKAEGLRPEVHDIIESELNKRGLNANLMKGIDAQNKTYSFYELHEAAQRLRQLPCPLCGDPRWKLNGTVAFFLKSFIVFTVSHKRLFIACPDCLDQKVNKAILSTPLLGWWALPSGLFKTPVYLIRNFDSKKGHRKEITSDHMISFTQSHIAEIEVYADEPDKLKEMIQPGYFD